MKIKFGAAGQVPAIDVDGEYEVIDSDLLHRFTLVDGVVVDAYPGKTDREVTKIDYDRESAKIVALRKAWDEAAEADRVGPKPNLLPAFVYKGE